MLCHLSAEKTGVSVSTICTNGLPGMFRYLQHIESRVLGEAFPNKMEYCGHTMRILQGVKMRHIYIEKQKMKSVKTERNMQI